MQTRLCEITTQGKGYSIRFNAMSSPCEILIDAGDRQLAGQVASVVSQEVWRIEDKYSRYKATSLLSNINNSVPIAIDEETYLLLNFADRCYQLSDGLFDITSGVLRKIWLFDGSDKIATQAQVDEILPFIGWEKVRYDQNEVVLPQGMQLDLGGIGKEYAVDRCILLIKQLTHQPVLVNLGGDLCATDIRHNQQPWQVGIEHPGLESKHSMVVSLLQGALATSGDANRYLLKNGQRYSHILNAKTGWPIDNAPKSITTVAPQCIQAGLLATLALLQGEQAGEFLQQQEVKHWLIK